MLTWPLYEIDLSLNIDQMDKVEIEVDLTAETSSSKRYWDAS